MTQAQRETWKNTILNNWDAYRPVLYWDGTGAFHQQLRDMDRMGGAIILIPSGMGTGKSIIANTLLKLWNVLKKNDDPPHIFWSKSEVRSKIRKTANDTAHSIDEDMKATGSGSGNLEIHMKNIFESIRKTGKLVVLVGVNVQPSRLGRAIELQILPIGFNRRYQANRFIVTNWKGEPLWLATTQRFYYPNDPVFYEGKLGCFGEYTDRALEFSSSQTGVFSGTNAEAESIWSTQLVDHWDKEGDGSKPSLDILEYMAIQIDIPQESVASIRRVCAFVRWVIIKNMKEIPTEDTGVEVTEGWQALQDLLFEQTDGSSDALSMVRYYVPIIKKISYRKLISRYDLETNRTTLYDAIDSQFVKLSPTAKGNAAELYIVRQLESVGVSCTWGGGRKSVSDVYGKGWAVAVKVAFREPYEIHTEPMTPEHRADLALCVFIRPRVHRVRIFPITSSKMALSGDSRDGGSSCGIDEIGKRLKELIKDAI